jgi:uncharacterized protein YktA (UPF0223 family)
MGFLMTGWLNKVQEKYAALLKAKQQARGDVVKRAKNATPSRKTRDKKLVKALEKQNRVSPKVTARQMKNYFNQCRKNIRRCK